MFTTIYLENILALLIKMSDLIMYIHYILFSTKIICLYSCLYYISAVVTIMDREQVVRTAAVLAKGNSFGVGTTMSAWTDVHLITAIIVVLLSFVVICASIKHSTRYGNVLYSVVLFFSPFSFGQCAVCTSIYGFDCPVGIFTLFCHVGNCE